MNINPILFSVIIFSMIPILFFDVFAQDEPSTEQISIFLQIEIRDSNGFLAGYFESADISLVDRKIFVDFLDANFDSLSSKQITINEEKFDVITIVSSQQQSTNTILSQSIVSDGSSIIVIANHDGYSVIPSDLVTKTWTIIRPA